MLITADGLWRGGTIKITEDLVPAIISPDTAISYARWHFPPSTPLLCITGVGRWSRHFGIIYGLYLMMTWDCFCNFLLLPKDNNHSDSPVFYSHNSISVSLVLYGDNIFLSSTVLLWLPATETLSPLSTLSLVLPILSRWSCYLIPLYAHCLIKD